MKNNEFFRNNKKKLSILLFVVLAAAAAVFFYIRQNKTQPAQEKVEKSVTVKTIKTGYTGNDVYLNYSGLVQPEKMEQATVATIGEIEKMYVKEGDNVKKGQILFRLDSSAAQRQCDTAYQNMKAAEAAKNSAKTTLDAAQKAYDSANKKATQQEKDDAANALAAAKKRRDDAQKEVDRVNQLTEVQQAELTAAQNNLAQKQSDFDAAYSKANSDGATAEDLTAFADATQAVVDAQKAVDEKQKNLDDARTQLDYTQKQSELTAAQAEVVSAQAEVDRLNSLGSGNSGDENLATQLETAKYAYESASASYEASKSTYESAKKQLDECTYRAGMDGYVIKTVSEEGGIATPLAPVLVVGSYNMVARFGVSQLDVKSVEKSMPATITVNGKIYEGAVVEIAVMPDETTRTYTTDVSIRNAPRDLYLGEIATVKISLGERDGVWLPLSVILNDGTDYVYIVKENRAVRQNVVISDINNDLVRVTGIEGGSIVISEGMKTVKSGNLVNVISED